MAGRAGDRVNSALGKHGYSQIKKVGEGSFGAAILVQHSDDRDRDSKAIVKMIDISRASKQERDDALKESRVLSQLRHPYIVRYRENFLEDGWLCIVMDYCEGGDLSAKVKRAKDQRKTFPEEQVLRWFTQSILALKYIHDLHILHRDLKSGNFFLSKSGNLKMGDFGIAKVLECTAACAQTQIGTPYYLSPEICQGKPYAWGSDIWSMGCILYEMAARKVPFDAPDLKTLIKRITSGSPPELPSEYSVGLRNLCRELLSRNPDDRPPAAEILKRPVVQEVVRRMLEEVKGEEEKGESSAAPAADRSSAASKAAARPSRSAATDYRDAAGTYKKNDHVEYYSATHKEWLPAVITNVDADGRIQLNVKPNVWLGMEVQSEKVRPKGAGAATDGAAEEPAPRSSSARPPRGGDAPVGSPARRGDERRPDSCRRQPSSDGAAMRRQNSRDGLAGQVQPLLDLLSTQGPVLRMRTFEILALFFSNNTHIQEAGIRRGAVPLFLRLMRGSAPGSDERNKAFRTLVALIRKIEAAEESFLRETDGIAVLVACMSLDELPALQEKAASFVRSLGGDRRLRSEDVASLAPAVGQLLKRAGENTRHIQYRETLAQCACELAVVAPTVCQDSLAEGVKARLAELTTASEPSEVEQEKATLEDCKQALGQ